MTLVVKIVQGLSANISKPAPLVLLVWLTLESCIDMNKMLFLWKMLCLPHKNIYRRITMFTISLLLSGYVHRRRESPISSMLNVEAAYKIDQILREHLLHGDFGDLYRWKRLIKRSFGIMKQQNGNYHVCYTVNLMCTETVFVTWECIPGGNSQDINLAAM